MDVFEKVARTKPESESAEADLAAARTRLMTEIRTSQVPIRARSGRRWVLAAGVAGAMVATTAGLLIAGSVTAPKPTVVTHPTSNPAHSGPPAPTSAPPVSAVPETPQAVLGAASASAIHGGLSPKAGQYLRVTWTSDVLLLGDGATVALPGQGVSYEAATRAWVIRTSGAFYIPADVTGDWYYTASAPPTVTANYGEGSAVDTHMEQFVEAWAAGAQEPRYATGGDSLPEGDGTPRSVFLTSLPTNADGVLAWLRDRANSGSAYHHEVMAGWTLMNLLACNAGTGEVRAAMLQALGTLPGATIADSHGAVRTIQFDSAFGESPDPGVAGRRHQTITIDVSTGRVSRISDTTNPGSGVVPADVVDQGATYEVALVDGLPD